MRRHGCARNKENGTQWVEVGEESVGSEGLLSIGRKCLVRTICVRTYSSNKIVA